jgi:multimeric flavodoxin WrbA
MKILVLNGSPRKKSDTIHITNAFLEGMNVENDCEIKIIDVIDKTIKPCLGCFQCIKNGNNKCVQSDDQNAILEMMLLSDIIIWSFPLYIFSLPSHLKAVLDRTIPFGKKEMRIENERVFHITNTNMKNKKYIMISGCGFPYFEDNFKAVKQMFYNMYTDLTTICISEAPMLGNTSALSLSQPLLNKIRNAGIEFKENGKLSLETSLLIETPMLLRDVYIRMCNNG